MSAGHGHAGRPLPEEVATVVRDWLVDAGVDFEESAPGRFAVVLPGEHKLRTTVALVVGAHSLSVNAFVIRRPDEAAAEIHEWLLERNARLYGVAYAVDRFGDIYLTGRMPLHAVTGDELDRWLGVVHENADGVFNLLLAMGFATAIRREWDWRVSRGESTANLEAFRHLAERVPEAPAD